MSDVQGRSYLGIVVRDDTGMFQVNRQVTFYREDDGSWRGADGPTFRPRVRVVPLAAKVWASRPWWTIVLAVVLFPIGLLALLYKVQHVVPESVVELTGADGRVTAFRLDADPGHLAVTVGG